jgi:hypothetical protein
MLPASDFFTFGDYALERGWNRAKVSLKPEHVALAETVRAERLAKPLTAAVRDALLVAGGPGIMQWSGDGAYCGYRYCVAPDLVEAKNASRQFLAPAIEALAERDWLLPIDRIESGYDVDGVYRLNGAGMDALAMVVARTRKVAA